MKARAILAGLRDASGARTFTVGNGALRSRLEAGRRPVRPARYDPDEITGLAGPVQRFFRVALTPGRPMLSALTLDHAGTFNMSERGERWLAFSSHQRVVLARPGFDWDARIRLLPGLSFRVHDAYVGGEGILSARLLGLPVLNLRGTPELARGELMRFLAEAAWYPTALLPSQGVQWTPIDDRCARATLADGSTQVSLTFSFGTDGLIESVRAEDRGRTVAGKVIPTPWEGRWGRYGERDGIRIPLEGEVAWILPDGRKPYWRGRITRLEYEHA
jgi:hypothetical protein